jgi:beta-lactamase class A
LRNDPSFRRLNPADQQRLTQQLRQVNQMPDEQRQRRLARAEMLERLSPQDRMRVNLSAQRWTAQPPQRQAMMTRAFRDLRTVPFDQRLTVLNSSRYKGVFSPEERGILADMLRVEPYQPAQP